MLRLALQILWPAFLAAIAAEGCFFAAFDVEDLMQLAGVHTLEPLAGYTLGFFFFWFWIGLGASLSFYLRHVPNDGNHRL